MMKPPVRAMIVAVLLGFTIIYITLRPVARQLLERDVMPSVYSAIVWPLMLVALLVVASLTARAFGQPRRRIVLISLLATLCSIAAIAVIGGVITTFALSAVWLFSEPASILLMFLLACMPALAAAVLSTKLPGRRPV